MIGLIVALVVVGCFVVFTQAAPLAAIEQTLPFLFYWHCTFGGIILVIMFGLFILGLIALIFGANKDKQAGAWVLFVLLANAWILGFPLLYILSVLILQNGIVGGEIVDQTNVYIGMGMYGVAMIGQIIRTNCAYKQGS